MPHRHVIKRTASTVVILLIASLGITGIAVTLFPPEGTEADLVTTLLGLLFSSLFLLAAWIGWRWSNSCLMCQPPSADKPPAE